MHRIRSQAALALFALGFIGLAAAALLAGSRGHSNFLLVLADFAFLAFACASVASRWFSGNASLAGLMAAVFTLLLGSLYGTALARLPIREGVPNPDDAESLLWLFCFAVVPCSIAALFVARVGSK